MVVFGEVVWREKAQVWMQERLVADTVGMRLIVELFHVERRLHLVAVEQNKSLAVVDRNSAFGSLEGLLSANYSYL
jgi:hypothetical protein